MERSKLRSCRTVVEFVVLIHRSILLPVLTDEWIHNSLVAFRESISHDDAKTAAAAAAGCHC